MATKEEQEIIERIQNRLEECKQKKLRPDIELSGGEVLYKEAIEGVRSNGMVAMVVFSLTLLVSLLVFVLLSTQAIDDSRSVLSQLFLFINMVASAAGIIIGYMMRHLKLTPSMTRNCLVGIIVVCVLMIRGLLPLLLLIDSIIVLKRIKNYKKWFYSVAKDGTMEYTPNDNEDDEDGNIADSEDGFDEEDDEGDPLL